MKQNKYDDSVFFEKYSNMDRSKNGLESAGEWHKLKRCCLCRQEKSNPSIPIPGSESADRKKYYNVQ